MPTANAITNSFGVASAPNISINMAEISHEGLDDLELLAWRRLMEPVRYEFLLDLITDWNFGILTQHVHEHFGVSLKEVCIMRKGYGCRSIIIGLKEYLLTGGYIYHRDISKDMRKGFAHGLCKKKMEGFLMKGGFRETFFMCLESVFEFGKYDGRSLDEVLEEDPRYIKWLHKEGLVELDDEVLDELKERELI